MEKIFIFDAVHTILRPVPDVITAYFLAGKRHGSLLTKEDVKSRFRSGRQELFGTRIAAKETKPGSLRSSDEIEFQLWKKLVTYVFNDVVPIDQLFQELWDHFASPQNWQLYDDVESCWQSIKADGGQIVIASNFDSRLNEILKVQSSLTKIDAVFCSAEVGYRKPDPMFYEVVAKTLKLNGAEQVIMTGDDFENDFVAPRLFGWNAVHLDRRSKEQSPDHEIQDLRSIVRHV